jgi:capsular polysaccharide biosynthesis protein
MENAGVITNSGVVYCPLRRAAVAETVHCWNTPSWTHSALRTPNFPKATHLNEPVGVISTLSGEGFYHFLLESLPRLAWLRKAGLPTGSRIVANGKAGSFNEAWLRDAGLEPSQILWADDLFHLKAREVYFTSYLMRDRGPDAWNINTLRTMFPPIPSTPMDRCLWISRTDAGKRQPNWEKMLLQQFPEFECVHLTSRTPAQQRLLFQSSRVIAGPHGAGFSNIIFCRPGTRLMEIFPKDLHMPLYRNLAHASGVDHEEIIANFDSPTASTPLVARLRQWLDESNQRAL